MTQRNSGSAAFLVCDIANALDALDSVATVIQSSDEGYADHLSGYRRALNAVRVMFGIPARDTVAAEPPANRLLEAADAARAAHQREHGEE